MDANKLNKDLRNVCWRLLSHQTDVLMKNLPLESTYIIYEDLVRFYDAHLKKLDRIIIAIDEFVREGFALNFIDFVLDDKRFANTQTIDLVKLETRLRELKVYFGKQQSPIIKH